MSSSRKRHMAYPPLVAYYFVYCLTWHVSFLEYISFLCSPRTYLGSHTWILLFYLRTYLGSHTWILLFYLRTFWAEHYVREAPPSCDGCWKCSKLWELIVEDLLKAIGKFNRSFLLMRGICFGILMAEYWCWNLPAKGLFQGLFVKGYSTPIEAIRCGLSSPFSLMFYVWMCHSCIYHLLELLPNNTSQ